MRGRTVIIHTQNAHMAKSMNPVVLSAAQGVGQGDDRRQGVGGGGQRDEQAQVACGGSAPPQPAVVYDVCGGGRERQNRSKPEKHTLF